MRHALISDIHSNLEALTAVLARIDASDDVGCLGDIVGYGPNPNECLALVRERASGAVLGNHDLAALDNFGIEYFNEPAREALEWTQTQLAPEHRAWLDSLGYELRMPGYLMVHGAPVDYFRYILDKRSAAIAFAATDAPLIFIGHSHIAESYALGADGEVAHRHFQHGGTLALEVGVRYIVNAGSVGQPRDLNPAASYATYDDAARTVAWERVAYDVAAVQHKIAAAHLPEVLAARLVQGR
ncbi:MAG: metallophosphoesterase family protein [Candidatus Dormibacteria bacterium]